MGQHDPLKSSRKGSEEHSNTVALGFQFTILVSLFHSSVSLNKQASMRTYIHAYGRVDGVHLCPAVACQEPSSHSKIYFTINASVI